MNGKNLEICKSGRHLITKQKCPECNLSGNDKSAEEIKQEIREKHGLESKAHKVNSTKGEETTKYKKKVVKEAKNWIDTKLNNNYEINRTEKQKLTRFELILKAILGDSTRRGGKYEDFDRVIQSFYHKNKNNAERTEFTAFDRRFFYQLFDLHDLEEDEKNRIRQRISNYINKSDVLKKDYINKKRIYYNKLYRITA